jgi:vacuolar-type H+-ATPase subunit H
MAETEVNVISHLLNVEHRASEMISGAQAEADKRIAASRAQAETEYKQQYDTVIAGLEADYKTRTDEIARRHNETISQYKINVQNAEQDIQSFNGLLDTLFTVN